MFLPRQLLRDLGTQKLRTFLTVCGMVWGTIAISLLLAFGDSFHSQMMVNAAGLGKAIVIAWPMRTGMAFEGSRRRAPHQSHRAGHQHAARALAHSRRDLSRVRPAAQPAERHPEADGQRQRRRAVRSARCAMSSRLQPAAFSIRSTRSAGAVSPSSATSWRRTCSVTRIRSAGPFSCHGSPFLVVGVMEEKIQQSNYGGPDETGSSSPLRPSAP